MRPLALFLVALPLCGACSKIESCRTELWLRRDAAADRIDVLLLSEGVSGRSEDAANLVLGLVAGERRIYGGVFFDWDLDDAKRFGSPEDFRLFQAVDVLWADDYLDAEDRLSIAQHFRIRDAGRVVARINALLLEGFLEKTPEEAEADLDPREEAARAFAQADRDVFTFEETMLWVAFPSTAQESWELEQALKYRRGVQGVSGWKIEEGAIVFRFGEPGSAEWNLAYDEPETTYDSDLRQELERRGLLHAEVTKEAILERFRACASEPATEPDFSGRRPIEED